MKVGLQVINNRVVMHMLPDKVTVKGLERGDLNEKDGTICGGYIAEKKRFLVAIERNIYLIKPENLMPRTFYDDILKIWKAICKKKSGAKLFLDYEYGGRRGRGA